MRKRIVIGNWKLHLTIPEATVLIEKLKKELKTVKNTEIVVCPNFLDIYPASKEVQNSNISLGAQDVFYEEQGAYTGEVSPVALSHFVKYVIVGHSERRIHFGETDKVVARKAEAAFANGIIPIICVGETLHENQDGLSRVVVMNQVETGVSHLTAEEVGQCVIAYEPVWAIGTGKVCKPADAEKMITNIRNLIKAIYGEKASEAVRIVYGGSVNDETVGKFASSKKIDGFLVGSASVDDERFSAIVNEVEKSAPEVKTEKKTVKAKAKK
jgi:triosephosphate isomerase